MSADLENFVQDNREAFDDESPAPEVWDRIRERVLQAAGPVAGKQETPVRSLPLKRWLTAAASVVLVAAAGWIYFLQHKTTEPLAVHPPKLSSDTIAPQVVAATNLQKLPDSAQTAVAGSKKSVTEKPVQAVSQEASDYNEEMYHYARLVEIKHNELKSLQKDEPLLYKQFSGDVNKLDSVYRTLKTQLPENPNREQVIEAMISNLQLQIGLLNKQLDIIKQIKHSKKAAYEKAYRSV